MKSFERKLETLLAESSIMNNLNDALHKTAWRGQNNLNLPKTKRWNYSQEREGGCRECEVKS